MCIPWFDVTAYISLYFPNITNVEIRIKSNQIWLLSIHISKYISMLLIEHFISAYLVNIFSSEVYISDGVYDMHGKMFTICDIKIYTK